MGSVMTYSRTLSRRYALELGRWNRGVREGMVICGVGRSLMVRRPWVGNVVVGGEHVLVSETC